MAAGNKILLRVEGGASLIIEDGNITFACPGAMTINAAEHLFDPEMAVPYYPLPQFSRRALPEVLAKFNLQVTDAPGPDGVAMPNTAWRIVHADSPGAALLTREALLEGQSNDQGKITLADEQETTLKAAYDQAPNRYWLVYGNQTREVALDVDKGDWHEQQNLFNALEAMGYSDTKFHVGGDNADLSHTALARQEYSTGSAQTLINKLKDQ